MKLPLSWWPAFLNARMQTAIPVHLQKPRRSITFQHLPSTICFFCCLEYPVSCQEVKMTKAKGSFTNKRGQKIVTASWKPAEGAIKSVMLWIHGFGEYADRFDAGRPSEGHGGWWLLT